LRVTGAGQAGALRLPQLRVVWAVEDWRVVQMTGRKGRVVSTKDGVQYESRSEVDVRLEILNLTEKQRFMDGEKVSETPHVTYSS